MCPLAVTQTQTMRSLSTLIQVTTPAHAQALPIEAIAATLRRYAVTNEAKKKEIIYGVRDVSADVVIYASTSRLEAEMVAISLALASLYREKGEFLVERNGRPINHYDSDTAFAAMQTKMRNLVYNKKVKPSMPFVPDRFTNMTTYQLVKAIKNNRTNDVRIRVLERLDEYVEYVKENY